MILADLEGFDWDWWNEVKNVVKHRVENKECEDVFFNQPKLIEFDEKHSSVEKRYKILGVTDRKRQLLVIFTVRNKKIRIISARDQSKKEKLQFLARGGSAFGGNNYQMVKKFKKIPVFKSEVEESKFWMTHDSTDYVDWSKAKKNISFINLKRSTESISIRLPEAMLSDLKVIANKKDVPYQSYVKIVLAEAVKREMTL